MGVALSLASEIWAGQTVPESQTVSAAWLPALAFAGDRLLRWISHWIQAMTFPWAQPFKRMQP